MNTNNITINDYQTNKLNNSNYFNLKKFTINNSVDSFNTYFVKNNSFIVVTIGFNISIYSINNLEPNNYAKHNDCLKLLCTKRITNNSKLIKVIYLESRHNIKNILNLFNKNIENINCDIFCFIYDNFEVEFYNINTEEVILSHFIEINNLANTTNNKKNDVVLIELMSDDIFKKELNKNNSSISKFDPILYSLFNDKTDINNKNLKPINKLNSFNETKLLDLINFINLYLPMFKLLKIEINDENNKQLCNINNNKLLYANNCTFSSYVSALSNVNNEIPLPSPKKNKTNINNNSYDIFSLDVLEYVQISSTSVILIDNKTNFYLYDITQPYLLDSLALAKFSNNSLEIYNLLEYKSLLKLIIKQLLLYINFMFKLTNKQISTLSSLLINSYKNSNQEENVYFNIIENNNLNNIKANLNLALKELISFCNVSNDNNNNNDNKNLSLKNFLDYLFEGKNFNLFIEKINHNFNNIYEILNDNVKVACEYCLYYSNTLMNINNKLNAYNLYTIFNIDQNCNYTNTSFLENIKLLINKLDNIINEVNVCRYNYNILFDYLGKICFYYYNKNKNLEEFYTNINYPINDYYNNVVSKTELNNSFDYNSIYMFDYIKIDKDLINLYNFVNLENYLLPSIIKLLGVDPRAYINKKSEDEKTFVNNNINIKTSNKVLANNIISNSFSINIEEYNKYKKTIAQLNDYKYKRINKSEVLSDNDLKNNINKKSNIFKKGLFSGVKLLIEDINSKDKNYSIDGDYIIKKINYDNENSYQHTFSNDINNSEIKFIGNLYCSSNIISTKCVDILKITHINNKYTFHNLYKINSNINYIIGYIKSEKTNNTLYINFLNIDLELNKDVNKLPKEISISLLDYNIMSFNLLDFDIKIDSKLNILLYIVHKSNYNNACDEDINNSKNYSNMSFKICCINISNYIKETLH